MSFKMHPTSVIVRLLSLMVIAIPLAMTLNTARAGTLLGDPLVEFMPLSQEEMAGLRGGFMTADGIEITIGYEQAAFINGILQTKLALDISRLDHRNAAKLASDIQPIRIIQSGEGNLAPAPALSLPVAGYLTLLQNSLDNQTLHNLTVLNIDIKNLPTTPFGSLGNTINDQLLNSLF